MRHIPCKLLLAFALLLFTLPALAAETRGVKRVEIKTPSGETVGPHREGFHEFGYYPLTLTEDARGFFPEGIYGTESHYHGFSLPEGATPLATTEHFLQAFSFGKTTYGFQFHPECTRENFKRWQVSDFATYGQPGAQTQAEQDELSDRYDRIQADWLDRFLTDLVGPSS